MRVSIKFIFHGPKFQAEVLRETNYLSFQPDFFSSGIYVYFFGHLPKLFYC